MSVSTRSMKISDELKYYLEKLVHPLATNDSIQEMSEKEITSKFEKKIMEQDGRIIQLESVLALRQNTIDKLLDKLDTKCDDNEQYSRRSCIRIHGIEWNKDDKDENVKNIVSELLSKNEFRNGSKEYYKTSVVSHIVMTRLASNSPFKFLY